MKCDPTTLKLNARPPRVPLFGERASITGEALASGAEVTEPPFDCPRAGKFVTDKKMATATAENRRRVVA
jgi:hypothetical protein